MKPTQRASTKAGAVQQAHSHATAAAKASAAADHKATDDAERALEDAHERIRTLEASLRTERHSHEQTLDEIHALRPQVVGELRCPRCGQYAGPKDWATQNTAHGTLVYHKPCGYHRGGLLDATSIFGRHTQT